MNTPKDTPGSFVGGSGEFSSPSVSAPGPSRKRPLPVLLPIVKNTIGFGTDIATAREVVTDEENKANTAAASLRGSLMTLPLAPTLPSKLQTDAPVAENNEGKSSLSLKENVFPTSAKKSRSLVDSDGDRLSTSGEEENVHCQTGYVYGTQGNRQEARAACGTEKSLPRFAITHCPTTFSWLEANFENAPGSAVPRELAYDQYVTMCAEKYMKPANSASFGKMIRIVFPEIKTRRLGIRGNSKYHYDGVYFKEDSRLHPMFHKWNSTV